MAAMLQIVPKTFAQHDKIVAQGITAFDAGMESLIYILDHELWDGEYDSETAYLREVALRHEKSRTWVIRQVSMARGKSTVGKEYEDLLLESHWRELQKFDTEHLTSIVQTVINRYGGITASRIRRVGEDMAMQALGNSSELDMADQEARERQREHIAQSTGFTREVITSWCKLSELPLRQLRQLRQQSDVYITIYRQVPTPPAPLALI